MKWISPDVSRPFQATTRARLTKKTARAKEKPIQSGRGWDESMKNGLRVRGDTFLTRSIDAISFVIEKVAAASCKNDRLLMIYSLVFRVRALRVSKRGR